MDACMEVDGRVGERKGYIYSEGSEIREREVRIG